MKAFSENSYSYISYS